MRDIGIDFAVINQKLKYITLKLDHQDINEVLMVKNATAEIIARRIYDEMRKYFSTIYSIILQEGNGGTVEYVGISRRWG
jgi:6-pyruvoyl-tetrahydropterin synthase